MIPDDPRKALEFVAAFLPGFLGLGLASYLVDIRFGEFWYAFISIALSALSFQLAGLLMRLKRGGGQSPSAQGPGFGRTLASYVIALFLGTLIAVAYDRDWTYELLNRLPFTHVAKTSEQRPLLYVIRAIQTCTGTRPIDGREDLTEALTQTMLRATVKDYGVVEGFVRVRPTDLDPDQVFLSPACMVRGATTTAIPGPGVLLQGENVIAWELVDATTSACWKIHYGDDLPCVCPSKERQQNYLAKINEGRPRDRKYKLCGDGR